MFRPATFSRLAVLVCVATLLAASAAAAKDLKFATALSGDTASTMTGSRAVGRATISVDTEAQTVSIALNIEGLTTGDLWSNLAKTPLGAIHLHIYGGRDHSAAADSMLLFPLPMGPTYTATAKGFRVEISQAPYALSAKAVNSKASFEDFVSALQAGRVVLNVHTNRVNDGEISGDVIPAQNGPA